MIFLSGGGYIYSVYPDTNAPGPIYSTFGCDEVGECFDPRFINDEPKQHEKRSKEYEYWKRHPIGK